MGGARGEKKILTAFYIDRISGREEKKKGRSSGPRERGGETQRIVAMYISGSKLHAANIKGVLDQNWAWGGGGKKRKGASGDAPPRGNSSVAREWGGCVRDLLHIVPAGQKEGIQTR